ncbi:ATP-binding protein [Krasilnikovia cinnamomea]|uniref:ATP-binding protein n=1 Tax=Krasilnikovia cinnamomea TaxID=349313 RepID=UPI001A939DFB|nr:helix-turn-helix domain-containing protein [Krasilnikovia cinnamomea]
MVTRFPSGQAGIEEFGQLVLRHRLACKLTQEELSEQSGLSTRAISDIERGRARRPQRRSLEALADALRLRDLARAEFLAAGRNRQARDTAPPADGTGEAVGSLCALPPDTDTLTGRDPQLVRIEELARAAADGKAAVPIVVVISGPAGIGKSALANHVAYRLADQFPDGQLFIDLRAMDTSVLTAAEALARLLYSLGVAPGDMPAQESERASLYRSLLRGRRVLIVLDNVADEAQVRPLLPAEPRCLILLTSRYTLPGLGTPHRVGLELLSPDDARTLLRDSLGADRVDAEPQAADRLITLCGRLPLALRIVANRLLTRAHWSLAQFAERLSDERQRLELLQAGDLAVESALHLSYRQLGPEAVVFRRLALAAGGDFDRRLAATLADISEIAAEDQLEDLVDAHLLEPAGRHGRYRFHDLVRLFAARRLDEDDTVRSRVAAHRRMVRSLLHTAVLAGSFYERDPDRARRLRTRPADVRTVPIADRQQAQNWLETELPHWLPALREAARLGLHDEVIEVGGAMHWYSDVHAGLSVWIEVFGLAAAAARASGRRHDEAVQLNFLGWAHGVVDGGWSECVRTHEQALTLAREIGDRREESWALSALSYQCAPRDPERSERRAREAVEISAGLEDSHNHFLIEANLAAVLCMTGKFAEAAELHGRLAAMLAEAERVEGAGGTASSLRGVVARWLAQDLEGMGRHAEAVMAVRTAVELFAVTGNRLAQALSRTLEADLLRTLGDQAGAGACLQEAVELFSAMKRFERVADVLLRAAELSVAGDDRAAAQTYVDRAREVLVRLDPEPAGRLSARISTLVQQPPFEMEHRSSMP